MLNIKWGWIALVAAVLVGFSRIYLFVHFPTDVLVGAILGAVMAVITVLIMRKTCLKRKLQRPLRKADRA